MTEVHSALYIARSSVLPAETGQPSSWRVRRLRGRWFVGRLTSGMTYDIRTSFNCTKRLRLTEKWLSFSNCTSHLTLT